MVRRGQRQRRVDGLAYRRGLPCHVDASRPLGQYVAVLARRNGLLRSRRRRRSSRRRRSRSHQGAFSAWRERDEDALDGGGCKAASSPSPWRRSCSLGPPTSAHHPYLPPAPCPVPLPPLPAPRAAPRHCRIAIKSPSDFARESARIWHGFPASSECFGDPF
nr:uncharacterized protein LOC113819160 isoform X5 [Penaeus vannamei]